jgi:hypothetical protein
VSEAREVHAGREAWRTGGFVGYFGLAETKARVEMARWLRAEIDRWPGSRSAESLGILLRDKLQDATSPRQRRVAASGFYIGTFERREGVMTPVFWYVWNYDGIDPKTGEYLGLGDYRVEEHFPRNHPDWDGVSPRDIRAALRAWERSQGIPFWLVNGELALAARTREALTWAVNATVTQLPGYRLPDSIGGWEELADILVRTNGRLMRVLRATTPTVEGPYRKAALPWPT